MTTLDRLAEQEQLAIARSYDPDLVDALADPDLYARTGRVVISRLSRRLGTNLPRTRERLANLKLRMQD